MIVFYFLPFSYIYFPKQRFPDSFVTQSGSLFSGSRLVRQTQIISITSPLHHHYLITITLRLSFIIVIDPFRCSGRKKYPVKTMIIIIITTHLSLSLLYLYITFQLTYWEQESVLAQSTKDKISSVTGQNITLTQLWQSQYREVYFFCDTLPVWIWEH